MHESFTTTTHGLLRDMPPMRLFEKAKRLGIWNPSDIDFSQDARDWLRLKDDERDVILRLTSLFQAGEEAVTLDLLPLVMAIARVRPLGRGSVPDYFPSLLVEHPAVWAVIEDTMNELLPAILGVIGDAFTAYGDEGHMPFDLELDEMLAYATRQFEKRAQRLERARGASLEDVYRVTGEAIEQEDA